MGGHGWRALLSHTSERLERGSWDTLKHALAQGFEHPKQRQPSRWTPRDTSPDGLARLLDTAVAIARYEVPLEFAGTRFDPPKLSRLEADVRGFFELLDVAEGVAGGAWTLDRARFAAAAPQSLEPFVAKLLARCATDDLRDAARDKVDLSRLLVLLHRHRRSPFLPQQLSMKPDAFRDGNDAWDSLAWSLWTVVGARIDASHLSPDVGRTKGLEHVWCTVVTLLSITELSIDLFDEAGGRLPPSLSVVKRLGAGGMGEVFLAVDRRTQSHRAVKVLRVSNGTSEAARQTLLREAKSLDNLGRCRRVVRFYDVQEVQAGVALVMAYVEGESLQQELDQTGPLSVSDAVSTTLEVLAALTEIHTEGIVHRDVKPSNFIRTSNGIVAIDFGLSRPQGSDLTQPARAGSDRFVAPEQLEGRADHRSDLYAAARLLYALLSGVPPVHDADPLSKATTDVSAALDVFYRKATARDPSDRFQSADEMRAALEATRGTVVPELRDSLDEGGRWGEYHIERRLAHLDQRWTLVRARRREAFSVRPRLVWVHHHMDAQERARLLTPCAALLELSTPGIQALEEIVEEPSHALVFEQHPPASLAEVLKRCATTGRRMSVFGAIRLAWEVVVSFGELHERLLARDLEQVDGKETPCGAHQEMLRLLRLWPPGIRIWKSGRVQLSLFELLRDVRRGVPIQTLAPLRYKAPELVFETEAMSIEAERAHVYSVALVLWECLVGSQARAATTLDDLRREVYGGSLPSPSARGASVPRDVEALLASALSLDPSARPATLMEFARQLGSCAIQPHTCMEELIDILADPRGGAVDHSAKDSG